MVNILPPPPVREPISISNGLISSIWVKWFFNFFVALGNQTGNVNGPDTSIDGEVALFDGTDGQHIKGGGLLGTMAFETAIDYARNDALAQVAFTGDFLDLVNPPGIFKTIKVAGQDDIVAIIPEDTIEVIDSSNIFTLTSGTLNTLTSDLTDTAVIAGSYGAADTVGTFTVDAKGRLTAASDVLIDITASQVNDFDEAAQDAVGTILTDTATIDFTYNDAGNQITADLKNTTVAAGSYGSASQVATYTVDAQGRLTASANTPILITASQVSDFSAAATELIEADFTLPFMLMGA